MSLGAWLRTPVDDHCGLVWPRWVPLATTVCAVAIAVAALAQRGALVPPGAAVVPALIAVGPWLVLEGTGYRPMPTGMLAACVIGGVYWLLLDPAMSDVAPFLLVLLTLEVGATSRPLVTVATVGATVAPIVFLDVDQDTGSWWVWLPGLAAGGLAGFAARTQMLLLSNERASRTALAERIAAEQRRDLAREVHDVVAHSLSVTMLYVTAARHALEADADVTEAVDSLRDAERIGRQAMGDIRRTVGLLDPASGDTRPLPGADDLAALVEEFREAGLAVTYRSSGSLDGLAPNLALGVYRVAQESLANVAKHAPGATVDVAVTAADAEVALVVDSSGAGGDRHAVVAAAPDAGPGRGLRGMAERVALLGGRLDAGPTPTGWHVRATFPRGMPSVPAGPVEVAGPVDTGDPMPAPSA